MTRFICLFRSCLSVSRVNRRVFWALSVIIQVSTLTWINTVYVKCNLLSIIISKSCWSISWRKVPQCRQLEAISQNTPLFGISVPVTGEWHHREMAQENKNSDKTGPTPTGHRQYHLLSWHYVANSKRIWKPCQRRWFMASNFNFQEATLTNPKKFQRPSLWSRWLPTSEAWDQRKELTTTTERAEKMRISLDQDGRREKTFSTAVHWPL